MQNANDAPPPDLRRGVRADSLESGGMIVGRAGDEDVLLARSGEAFFAVSPRCTHYGGPLADGLVVNDTVRCPLHHACFSLRTGEADRPPAFEPLSCWRVERQGDTVFVRDKIAPAPTAVATSARPRPESAVIVGAGAAGFAAADTLRREGYEGPVTIVDAEPDLPIDRPNLSKDFLSGEAQDDWMPLQPRSYYDARRIDLVLGARVASIDVSGRRLSLADGTSMPFGVLLLATGADPIHLPIPGADGPGVCYLRSFRDAGAMVERAKTARHAVVAGASFIGLEVAASLRARGVAVDVVAPEGVPLERIVGRELGEFVRRVHESHGVVFHLGDGVARVDGRTVTLGSGATLDADLVVMGVGVRPAVALAAQAGLAMDHGILVDEYLETSAPGVFAAGDIARWPDPRAGGRIRVEHWVVAERQGRTAARNMLGRRERFDAVPFFWSRHFDASIKYVGHAPSWDEIRIDGRLDAARAGEGCTVTYLAGGRRLAVATVGRDRDSLEAELAMERDVSRSG